MKVVRLPGATAAIAGAKKSGMPSVYLGEIGNGIAGVDMLSTIYQRVVSLPESGVLPEEPYNMEFAAVLIEMLHDDASVYTPHTQEYNLYGVLLPSAAGETSTQFRSLPEDIRMVVDSGSSSLPFRSAGDFSIGNFATYFANAINYSTFMPPTTSTKYIHADDNSGFRIAGGAEYHLQGRIYIDATGGEDQITTATMAYRIGSTSTPIDTQVVLDGTSGSYLLFDALIDRAGEEDTTLKIFLSSYTTQTTGILGSIIEDKSFVSITDMNKYALTQTFGPFPLYDSVTRLMYEVIVVASPVSR